MARLQEVLHRYLKVIMNGIVHALATALLADHYNLQTME